MEVVQASRILPVQQPMLFSMGAKAHCALALVYDHTTVQRNVDHLYFFQAVKLKFSVIG